MSKGLLYRIFAAVLVALFIAVIFWVSWISVCGIVYLITLCFGWGYCWKIATGIWLIVLIVGHILVHKE